MTLWVALYMVLIRLIYNYTIEACLKLVEKVGLQNRTAAPPPRRV